MGDPVVPIHGTHWRIVSVGCAFQLTYHLAAVALESAEGCHRCFHRGEPTRKLDPVLACTRCGRLVPGT